MMTDRRKDDWRPLSAPSAKVLLIDDDPDIHVLVEAMLRPLQVQFASAYDAESGVAQAIAMRPDRNPDVQVKSPVPEHLRKFTQAYRQGDCRCARLCRGAGGRVFRHWRRATEPCGQRDCTAGA